MKAKFLLPLMFLIICCLNAFAQEPFKVNGYLLFERDGRLFNIVGNDTLKVIPDVIVLKYKEGITDQQKRSIEQTYRLKKEFHAPTNWINYKLESDSDVVDIVKSLSKNPMVYEVLFSRRIPLLGAVPNEPNWRVRDATIYCPYTGYIWEGLDQIPVNASHLVMAIDSAWNLTTGSPSITIGFIDTGTDIYHPEIGYVYGSEYSNLWVNPFEIPGDGIDNDGNGYIDDIHGWNFSDDNNIIPPGYHGTIVAGIASAKTNNAIGTFGVAGGWNNQGTRIMSLALESVEFPGLEEHETVPALLYAAQNGARIVNMSFGDTHWYFKPLDDAINLVVEEYDLLIFAAAGNENNDTISWPARHPKVNAVGASTIFQPWTVGEIRWWQRKIGNPNIYIGSNFGPELDFVATSHGYTVWGTFKLVETSGAAAFASGIAALVLSANPYLTNNEVREILTSTADKIDPTHFSWQPNGHSTHYGYGRLNAYQAVQAAIAAMGHPAITITADTTWSAPRRQAGNVTIKPGATLTITSSLGMIPGTKIVVERGARLIVDHGVITSVGHGNRWKGIEVWGTSSQRQLVMHQGWVRVINGGKIKNSEMGIYTNRMDYTTGGWVPGYTGGIVHGNNASFVNNKVALQFFSYGFPSVSGFSNSEFVTYGGLMGGAADGWMVEITDISGVRFSACNFLNKSPNQNYFKNGMRIVNSHVRFSGRCISTVHPCQEWEYGRFERLNYGIYATAVSPSRFVDIQRTEFKNNFRGLYLGSISNAVVLSNRFTVNSPFVTNGGYGMYLDFCTGYWVEDNHFEGYGASRIGIGLIVNNSGTSQNEIYRNWFENLQQGISAQGVNRHPSLNQGLQILCNEFINCDADLLIMPIPTPEGGPPMPVVRGGIAPHQGANMPDVHTAMAGNLFDIHSPVPDGDFDDINNQASHITYHYPSRYSDDRVYPVDVTKHSVYTKTVEFTAPWTFEFGCPPTISGNGGAIMEELLADAEHWSAQASQTDEQLTALIDAGNTQQLQWDVYMATNPQAVQLYNELMSISPYLSDTVVSSAIFKDDVLVNAMLRDIMVANPHTAKSPELLEQLGQRWVPFPEFMKEQVLEGRNITTSREELETKHAKFDLNRSVALNKLAQLFHNSPDSLGWLYSLHNYASLGYKYAFSLLKHGQALQGMEVLNNMAAQLCPTALDAQLHTWMGEAYSLLAGMLEQGIDITQPDSIALAQAWEIHDNASGLPAAYARSLLQAWEVIDYQEPVLLPVIYKSGIGIAHYPAGREQDTELLLSVRPNPARDYLIVAWEVPGGGQASLDITDASGRIVHRQKLQAAKDEQVVALQNWMPGAYQATIRTDSGSRQTVRFLISR